VLDRDVLALLGRFLIPMIRGGAAYGDDRDRRRLGGWEARMRCAVRAEEFSTLGNYTHSIK
jgi:hypothetical protein